MALRHVSVPEERLSPEEARTFLRVHAEREAGGADGPRLEDLAEALHLPVEEARAILREARSRVATVPIVLWTGGLSLVGVLNRQLDVGWFVFSPPGLVSFALLTIANIAEVNRAPFDLPEAESELIAGYHTEYSGMRFGLFFLAEYVNMVTVSAMATTLFLGGGA